MLPESSNECDDWIVQPPRDGVQSSSKQLADILLRRCAGRRGVWSRRQPSRPFRLRYQGIVVPLTPEREVGDPDGKLTRMDIFRGCSQLVAIRSSHSEITRSAMSAITALCVITAVVGSSHNRTSGRFAIARAMAPGFLFPIRENSSRGSGRRHRPGWLVSGWLFRRTLPNGLAGTFQAVSALRQ